MADSNENLDQQALDHEETGDVGQQAELLPEEAAADPELPQSTKNWFIIHTYSCSSVWL